MRRTFLGSRTLKIWGLALLALAGAARAQVQVGTAVPPALEAPPVEVRDGAVVLSLEESVELALRRNLGLIVERQVRNEASLGVRQNLGIYDLLASGVMSARDETSATVSALEASAFNQQQFNFFVDQLLPSGGTLQFGWENFRQESNNRFVEVNPSYDTNLTFDFTQPLLRNFGRLATEQDILIARNRNLQSREEFERQVTTTTQEVINAYWTLVGARQQLIVAQQSLDLARELHDRNRIQVEVGTMAPLELVQSEAAIATREEEIIRAQASVGDAEDQLRLLLNLPAGELWQTEIRPASDPAGDRVQIDLGQAIETALARRPEVQAQQLRIEQARLDDALARNLAKPELNLNLNYGFSGTGGDRIVTENGQVVGVIPGGYSDAFEQATGLDFDGWTARLTFGYPLQNRAARTRKAIANIALQRAQTQMEQLRQSVTTEVRQAARRVETAAKQIDAARASVRFQERSLDAERKRYENGMSSSFEITRIQDDLTRARSREVDAVIAYRTALADFYRLTGQLLETQGVALDDPDQPLDRWQFRLFGGR